MKKFSIGMSLFVLFIIISCGSPTQRGTIDVDLPLDELINRAQEEGMIESVGMPDAWANWQQTWADLKTLYGINHNDTDMTSAEEISKVESEGRNGTIDIGDVGAAFGSILKQKNLALPYKTSYWTEIPDWAKDPDGTWALAYTGTMAFIINKKLTGGVIPTSWKDLLESSIKMNTGDPRLAANYAMSVLSAAYAFGGSDNNIEPGVNFFEKMAQQKRLSFVEFNLDALKREEIAIEAIWDFRAIKYLDDLGTQAKDFVVVIPSDGAVITGYIPFVNKWAPRPYAAMLAKEYIFSDAGQINLARGYARPIRSNIEFPDDVKSKMLPAQMYENAKPIQNQEAVSQETKKLQRLWQERVVNKI
ncbi:MAG: ABC transporter substrate-binding protein [Spirochaetia bacterium]